MRIGWGDPGAVAMRGTGLRELIRGVCDGCYISEGSAPFADGTGAESLCGIVRPYLGGLRAQLVRF